MNPPPRPAPSHVPTLTEVIEIPDALPAVGAPVMPTAPLPVPSPVPSPVQSAVAEPATFEAPVPPVPPAPAVPPAQAPLPPVVAMPAPLPVPVSVAPLAPASPVRTGAGVDEAAMAQRVLNEVQRQIDGMLEYRLREALTPILARTSESLVRELRQELSKTMRDVVSRAVAQEVARQRTRP